MLNIIEIQFDGGCRPTNPGNKYGSFAVWHMIDRCPKHLLVKQLREEYGIGTNNEAEFDALIKALCWTGTALEAGGFRAEDFTVRLYTDSTVVGFRINGTSTANKSEPERRMHALAQRCLIALKRYGGYGIDLIGRQRNVELFGH